MESTKMTLNIVETCEALNLSRPIVMQYIRRKDNPLPCIKTGKRYRIPCASLEKWIIEEAARNSGTATGKR